MKLSYSLRLFAITTSHTADRICTFYLPTLAPLEYALMHVLSISDYIIVLRISFYVAKKNPFFACDIFSRDSLQKPSHLKDVKQMSALGFALQFIARSLTRYCRW